MTRVLLTAFEPYDRWAENSSWLALVDLTRWYEGPIEIVTRRYPVDLTEMCGRLRQDLLEAFDLALHVGQAPGETVIELESIGLNVRSDSSPLVRDAAVAYRSTLPLEPAAQRLRQAGIPAAVSHHAGTHLCNATLFLSLYYADTLSLPTGSALVHLPLTPAQVAREGKNLASMSTPMASAALALLLDAFAQSPGSASPSST